MKRGPRRRLKIPGSGRTMTPCDPDLPGRPGGDHRPAARAGLPRGGPRGPRPAGPDRAELRGRHLPEPPRRRWTRCSRSSAERFRRDDLLTRDEREGDRFLLFLSGPRRGETPLPVRPPCASSSTGSRSSSTPAWGVSPCPTCGRSPGSGSATGSSSGAPSRAPSARSSDWWRMRCRAPPCAGQLRDRDQRERLLEIIQNREIWTAFQPIIDLDGGEIVGWEGLSRGPRGSELELPLDAVRSRGAPRGDRGAGAGLPPPGLRGLEGPRPRGSPLHQHRPRHGARHELSRPRGVRLPRHPTSRPRG